MWAAHALHILWRHMYSVRLINNHYPWVTSLSLLGTPIALAESFSVIRRAANCLVRFSRCLSVLPPESRINILFAWRTNRIQLVNWAKTKGRMADDRHNAYNKIRFSMQNNVENVSLWCRDIIALPLIQTNGNPLISCETGRRTELLYAYHVWMHL